MVKNGLIVLALVLMPLAVPGFANSSEHAGGDKILAVVQKMISVVETVEDFTCETEVLYYEDGAEDQQWRLKFFFKKGKKFRVDFSYPFRGVSVFYKGGDERLTVRPFRFLPAVKLHFSIDSPIVKAPSGQRIDQTDVEYFIRFIFKNLNVIQQRKNEFQEDGQQIKFLFWAMDYIKGKYLEKYRVFVSKKNWFPVRVERYSIEDKLIEVIVFKNYVINALLEDKLFVP